MVFRTRIRTTALRAYTTFFVMTLSAYVQAQHTPPIHIPEQIPQPQESQDQEQTRALHLNLLLEKQLRQLDTVNGILQYLGQALNKGVLKLDNTQQQHVRAWITDHQKILHKLTQTVTYPLHESQISALALSVKLLIMHVKRTVDHKFKILDKFTLDTTLITRARSAVKLDTIEGITQNNDQQLTTLKINAEKVGLTRINTIARTVDKFNDKWRITNKLSYAPMAVLTGAAAVHVLPDRWFPNQGKLREFKNWISTSSDNSGDNQEQQEHQRPRGWFSALLDFASDKNTKTMGTLLYIVGGWDSIKPHLPQFLQSGLDNTSRSIRNKWEQLKGFSPTYTSNSYSYDTTVTLDDERLVGLDTQIAQLRSVVQYITDPEIYDRSNAQLEKGILLVGPSRSGKTYAARALHGSINKALAEKGSTVQFGFKELKWEDISWTSEEGIKTALQEAKKNAPCVIFIDELHNYSLQTKDGMGKMVNEFLTGMSGLTSESDTKGQVIFLAATNHPELLDHALLQPGRFGTIIYFEKPHFEQRKKYFETMFKHNAIDTSTLDINSLARQTENCSYGDLEFIVKQARFTARSQARSVTQQHLQDQINNHVYKFKHDLTLTQREKQVLAAHQTGHALAYVLLEPQTQLETVTILARHRKIKEQRVWNDEKHKQVSTKSSVKYGGLFTYNTAEALQLETAQEQAKQCQILLSGALAEKLLLGSIQAKHHLKDKQKALEYAHKIVLDGLKPESLPSEVQEQMKKQAYELLTKIEQEAYTLLQKHKHLVQAIAHALETYNTLSADDIRLIIRDITKDQAVETEQSL